MTASMTAPTAAFSTGASLLGTSDARLLFEVAQRPGMVSFAGGMPDTGALPIDTIAALAGDVVSRRGRSALQYGSAQGDPALRERICEVMTLEGIEADPADVVVTVGSQQALDLVARIHLDPGDIVLVERPTYVAAIGVFRSYQASVVHIATDEDGLVPGSLADTLDALAPTGRVKLLYTVPRFQNPTGTTLHPARRAEVLRLCRRAGVLVVEDDPYGLLGFAEEPVPALRAEDDDVVYLGSFSKTFAPGMRVGWVLAPPRVRELVVRAAGAAILSHSMFAQLVVERYFATQPWLGQLAILRDHYAERCAAMLCALSTHLPSTARWTRPRGGFYVWVELPAAVDTSALLPGALAAGVAYVPGAGFFADGSGRSAMRLCFCLPTPDRIVDGVARLGPIVARAVG